MEEIVKLIVNNGLGVASFVALLYFIFYYMKNISGTMEKINDSLIAIQTNITQLNERVTNLENKE